MNYLHYMAISRIVKFEIPKYLENLIGIVIDKFNESGISTVDIGYDDVYMDGDYDDDRYDSDDDYAAGVDDAIDDDDEDW